MVDYAVLKQTGTANVPASLRAQALKALDKAAVPASSGLPRYVREGLVFPYAAGARLVNRIQGRGGWAAVDRAFGAGGPVSTEQVMHPAKYDAHERPVRVGRARRRAARTWSSRATSASSTPSRCCERPTGARGRAEPRPGGAEAGSRCGARGPHGWRSGGSGTAPATPASSPRRCGAPPGAWATQP